jgi:hypothetical protein
LAAIHLVIESMSPADTSTSIHRTRRHTHTHTGHTVNLTQQHVRRHICTDVYFDYIHVNKYLSATRL